MGCLRRAGSAVPGLWTLAAMAEAPRTVAREAALRTILTSDLTLTQTISAFGLWHSCRL